MRKNPLREMRSSGQPIINAWLSIGSSYAAEVVAHQGFDAVTVDCQHGMMGFETTVAMLQAISSTRAVPLVRPSHNDAAQIMRLLDAGAYGIICPMVSNRDDALHLVRSCRYPPVGARSFGPARGLLYGGPDYLAHANEEIIVLAMIETAEGLEKVDDIVSTPGIDGVYIGPNDLALALGRAPVAESDDPLLVDAIQRIRVAASSRGLIAGIFCSGARAAAKRVAEGFHLVTPGNDAGALRQVFGEAVRVIRGGAP